MGRDGCSLGRDSATAAHDWQQITRRVQVGLAHARSYVRRGVRKVESRLLGSEEPTEKLRQRRSKEDRRGFAKRTASVFVNP